MTNVDKGIGIVNGASWHGVSIKCLKQVNSKNQGNWRFNLQGKGGE